MFHFRNQRQLYCLWGWWIGSDQAAVSNPQPPPKKKQETKRNNKKGWLININWISAKETGTNLSYWSDHFNIVTITRLITEWVLRLQFQLLDEATVTPRALETLQANEKNIPSLLTDAIWNSAIKTTNKYWGDTRRSIIRSSLGHTLTVNSKWTFFLLT